MELTENVKKTLAWLDEVSTQAITEGQTGNTALLNRLGKESSFAYYLNNVHTRKVMSPEQYASQLPQLVTDAQRIMEQYEIVAKQPERDARLTAVEENLQKLMGMVESLVESKKPDAKKPAKKADSAKEETDANTGDELETEA